MKIDKKDLETRFKIYNQLFFENRLPQCKLSLSSNRDRWGFYIFTKNGGGHIYIAKNVRWNDEALKLVLIHEMAHHYVYTVIKSKFFSFPHGRHFNKIANQLYKKHKINVKLHHLPKPYFINEKIPTNFLQRQWRKYMGPTYLN